MNKLAFLVLVSLSLFVSSCSNDDESSTQRNTAEVTEVFKSYFYDYKGDVRCNKLDGFSSAEWAVGSEDGSIPLKVFSDITGMKVSVSGSYDYKFVSSDGKANISIVGKTEAGENAEYATFRVSIPSCPEIQVVHFGTEQYFKGTNGEDFEIKYVIPNNELEAKTADNFDDFVKDVMAHSPSKEPESLTCTEFKSSNHIFVFMLTLFDNNDGGKKEFGNTNKYESDYLKLEYDDENVWYGFAQLKLTFKKKEKTPTYTILFKRPA